jgi:hypothetical protein
MKHATNPPPGLTQDSERVFGRFPSVNDDWQAKLNREPNLRAKNCLLNVPGREIVVIVETNLTNRAGVVGLHRPPHHFNACVCTPRKVSGLMGMDSGGKAHRRPRLTQGFSTLRLGAVAGRQHAQGARHATPRGPADHIVEVGGELLAGEVAV